VIRQYYSDPENLYIEDHEALEQVIEKFLLPKFFPRKEDRDKEFGRLNAQFWKEHNDFHNKKGYFAKPYI
jgi:hypothetical protein